MSSSPRSSSWFNSLPYLPRLYLNELKWFVFTALVGHSHRFKKHILAATVVHAHRKYGRNTDRKVSHFRRPSLWMRRRMLKKLRNWQSRNAEIKWRLRLSCHYRVMYNTNLFIRKTRHGNMMDWKRLFTGSHRFRFPPPSPFVPQSRILILSPLFFLSLHFDIPRRNLLLFDSLK